MIKLTLVFSTILTIVTFAIGYAIEFVVTFIALKLDLPGPYSDSPVGWMWFAFSVTVIFLLSFGFCRTLVRRVEKRVLARKTFE